eukprot:g21032.t1
MGEILNEYFPSVFTVEKDVGDREHGEINNDILKHVYITEQEVLDSLKGIKVDKPPEPDQMYPRTLLEPSEVIAGPFAEMFVSSIATVLDPLLFIIYVNDLDVKIGDMISRFADDTKMG